MPRWQRRTRQKGTYDRHDVSGAKIYGTSRQQRLQILARDNHVCAYCGGPATQVDHIWPVFHGGRSKAFNLVAACVRCNQRKGPKMDCEEARRLGDSDHRNAAQARKAVAYGRFWSL